ncbi:Protein DETOXIFICATION [Heracleum sosnowskyi]|uniref:Protein DETOXIFICATION n=1 Tax=Heracleum sosnowskyi TaxID=360622 RepID=A0AAD8NDS1_9APIA|nr:Protein DETOXIFICATION [Heracleum sosnowskyi]
MEGSVSENLLTEVRRAKEEGTLKERVWTESKKMWIVAAPAIFTKFSTFGVSVISQAFIGHIGPKELAAYALVSTVLLRFANGVLLGMSSALGTLCGQSYGAERYDMLGLHLQRSWLILFICSIVLSPVFIFTNPILVALGQEESIAEVAGTISLWLIPGLFSFMVSYTCQMFLQAQSKNMIISYLAAFSLASHVFLSWILTVKYKFGLSGAMVSTILAYWIPNIGQLIYIFGGWCPETWKGFSMLVFKDLWPIIKLSLSSGVMICLELWYSTILVLLTGSMKMTDIAIAALSICLNISGWEMMISLGFLAAASVRVSNELGRGSSRAAKFSIVQIVLTSFVIGFVLFIFFLFFRGRLAYIFTESTEVAAAVADLSPLLACSILLNSIQPVLSGVAVGAGLQSTVAYVNIACYYLIGIPVGVVLGYVLQLHVKGVWDGMLFGTFVQTVALMIITYKTDWEEQVSVAQQRINKWSVDSDQQADDDKQNA